MTGAFGERGQSGLDRLAVFVVAIVIFVLVTPFILGFVGIDVNEQTDPSPEADGPREPLLVLGVRGDAIADSSGEPSENRSASAIAANRTIGSIDIILSATERGTPLDLTNSTVVWVGDEVYHLRPKGEVSAADDGQYDIEVDGAGSPPIVLEETTKRATLRFDLGSDDVDGISEFGSRLHTGESVTISIATDSGTVTREFTVPSRLPASGAVGL